MYARVLDLLIVFDEQHIRDMMETGFAFEHVEQFNPMTVAQREKYFAGLIDMAKNRPDKIQFRFLKSGAIQYPFVYGSHRLLYINYADTPYFEGFSIMLREKSVLKIMDDFAIYAWNNFTLSDKESINKMEKMKSMYIK